MGVNKIFSCVFLLGTALFLFSGCVKYNAVAPNSVSLQEDKSAEQIIVTDIEGNQRDLTEFAWAKKYPTLLDDFRGSNPNTLTDFIFESIANENLVPMSETLICDFRNEQLSICVQNVSKGITAEGIPADKMQEAEHTLGIPTESQEYLTVNLLIQNTGTVDSTFYLNNISLHCSVDGSVALGSVGTEMVASDLPLVEQNSKNQFQVFLKAGESKTFCVLYYVDRTLDISDLYLYPNFGGSGFSEVKTADLMLDQQWLCLGN